MSPQPVAYYFDYASPWAYLADALAPRELAGVALDHRPVYLRGLESFAQGMPYSSAKLAYLMRDLARCAEHHRVPIAPPASFPIDGLHLLRAAWVAKDRGAFEPFHRAAFRATWAEQRETGKKEVAAVMLAEAIGCSEAAALESMTAPVIKDRLREETSRAAERGVFGTPSWIVGEELFWGHDRIGYVGRAARG